MTPTTTQARPAHQRFLSALGRVTSATQTLRVRGEDATRAARHGKACDGLETAASRLEQIADDLEKAIA